MTTLLERCAQFLIQQKGGALWATSAGIKTLEDFVLAEVGRKADYTLEDSLPLCLYFPTEADREEFIAAIKEAKPNWTTKKV